MSDYISNTSLIKQVGNLTSISATDEYKITTHLPAAKQDVIKIISQETYDDIFAVDTDEDPETYVTEDKEKVALAESYMALSYIIPAVNNVSSGSGVVKETGFNDSRKQFLSESDIRSMVERYRSNAVRILADYRAEIDEDEDDLPDSIRTENVTMIAP